MAKIPSPPIWATLLILYLIICGIRIWYSFAFAGPQSIPDATAYDFIARSIIEGTFLSSGAYAYQYPPGYPFLLSISYLFGPDKIIIYHAQLILNALVAGLVLFPAYLLLRDWCTKEIAVVGSVVIATLPSISRSTGLIMSENLFIPLVFFALYFIYKAFKTDNQYIALIAGFLCFSVFITRSIGITMLIALVCGFMWYCYQHQKVSGSYIESLRKKWALLAGAFFPFAFAFLTTILIGGEAPTAGYHPIATLTSYAQNIGTEYTTFLQTFLLNMDYVILVSYCIGTVIAIYVMYLYLRGDITDVLNPNQKEGGQREKMAFHGMIGVAGSLLVLLALTPFYGGFMMIYGRYYDPLIPILFLFTMFGIQYLMYNRNIPKLHLYTIFAANILTSVFVVLTLQWNVHFDYTQNAVLLYLYSLPASLGVTIIVLLFGMILPIFLLIGTKKAQVMRIFFVLIIAINIITSIPMIQTGIEHSNNFDGVGAIGKYIQGNIDTNAVIFWDNSIIEDPFRNSIFYSLIDYWIVNDLQSANLTHAVLFDDYSAIQDADYIITGLKGKRYAEPIYTSPSGARLFTPEWYV